MTVVLVFVSGLLLSLLLEHLLLRPTECRSWRRPVASWCLHIGSWGLLFALDLLLVQRPWFALTLVTAFQLLILLVNQAKYASLREPFIVHDFEYFTDVFRHPRLYLPFLGVWRAGAAVLGFIGALVAGMSMEPSLLAVEGHAAFFSQLAVLVAGSAGLLAFGLKALPVPALKPATDLRQLGVAGSLWAYGRALWRSEAVAPRPEFEAPLSEPQAEQPHLLVVQSESFFDPRLSYTQVRSDVLAGFDRVCQQSRQYGRVQVPAWGANTVRSESAFLTGLNAEALGIHQFNPYWYLAKHDLPTLVSCMKAQGYETVCVHPYPQQFYLRDRVFPRLGFDRFIDGTAFDDSHKDGQYISDAAVTDCIEQLLSRATDRPLFVFVITMENHGPLHLESAAEIEATDFLNSPLPAGCDDLLVYLRHLKNADRMLERLTALLASQPRQGLLCWYGDHVPVMTSVYDQLGEPVADTPYLIWHSEGGEALERHLPLSEVAVSAVMNQPVQQRCATDSERPAQLAG